MCLAVPGKLVSAEGEGLEMRGRVDFGGVSREIQLAFVPEARVGDWVLVHAGVAIGLLDEVAAARTLGLLDELVEPDPGHGAPR